MRINSTKTGKSWGMFGFRKGRSSLFGFHPLGALQCSVIVGLPNNSYTRINEATSDSMGHLLDSFSKMGATTTRDVDVEEEEEEGCVDSVFGLRFLGPVNSWCWDAR